MNDETTQILKVDEVGRVRTPRARQDEILDGLESSAMTGAAFARHVGVKYPTLMNWVQRRRRERGASGSPQRVAAQWIEAVVDSPAQGEALIVELPHGVVLRVSGRVQALLASEVLVAMGFGKRC